MDRASVFGTEGYWFDSSRAYFHKPQLYRGLCFRTELLPARKGPFWGIVGQYYQHFNSGWTGGQDMLTLALNAAGREIVAGKPLSYNWLCAGWPRAGLKGDDFSDLGRYMGFPKCYFTAGMVGGNAGYYDYPKGGFGKPFPPNDPPNWLLQMVALSRVAALFSHVEDFLRDGRLLPGPDKHRISKELPAFELPTGDATVRVLVRKHNARPEWLVTAWAAGGDERPATVKVPDLGELTVPARPCGSVYRVTLKDGKPVATLLDIDGLLPTKALGPAR